MYVILYDTCSAITATAITYTGLYSIAIEFIPILFKYMPSENTLVLYCALFLFRICVQVHVVCIEIQIYFC